MAVALLAVLAVAVVLVAVGAVRFRGTPPDDTDRFHHAQQLTSTWSESYSGDVHEEPEAYEDKPEMQHNNVHLVDA